MAVLVHPNSTVKLVDHRAKLCGRVVTIKLQQDNHCFQIINVYAPNIHSEREQFFNSLWRFKFPNLDAIVVRDFNCIPDVTLDKWGGVDSFGNTSHVSRLHAFTDSLHLEDFYRSSNPSGRLYTWFNGPHFVGCRLDRFYTPRAWRPRVTGHNCTPFSYSDHHLISLKISLRNSNPRERGIWKFNTQLALLA